MIVNGTRSAQDVRLAHGNDAALSAIAALLRLRAWCACSKAACCAYSAYCACCVAAPGASLALAVPAAYTRLQRLLQRPLRCLLLCAASCANCACSACCSNCASGIMHTVAWKKTSKTAPHPNNTVLGQAFAKCADGEVRSTER